MPLRREHNLKYFMIEEVLAFAEKEKEKFLDDLFKLARIPSISAFEENYPDIERCAETLKDLMTAYGLENAQLLKIDGAQPLVYADWLHAGEDKPTLLLYAHYDVQPVGIESQWETPPFEPTAKGERVYGRGIVDDKAGAMVHLAAIYAYLQAQGSLPVNIKFISEGEEEIGSDNLEKYLVAHKDMLRCDMVILTDTDNIDTGIPSITYSLRGIVTLNVEVSALKQSVHSGTWGGPSPNPIEELSKIIASLTDDDGKILIPGIYDDVKRPDSAMIDALPYDEQIFRSQLGFLDGVEIMNKGVHPLEQMWFLPSLTVTAFESNEVDSAPNQIIASARARITIRTVSPMNGDKVLASLQEFITQKAKHGVKLAFSGAHVGNPWVTDISHPIFQKVLSSLESGYGQKATFKGCGGSIPFVETVTSVLGDVPALLVGIEDPYCHAHSENESMDLGDFYKSIRANIFLYSEVSQ